MPVTIPATTTNDPNAKSANESSNKSSIVILFDMWVLRVVSFQ